MAMAKEMEGGGLEHVMRAEMLVDRARKRAAAAARFRHQGREVPWRVQVNRCADLLCAALDSDPNNLSACFMLVGCLLQLGDNKGAKEQAQLTLREVCQGKGAVLQEPVLHLAVAHASLRLGEAQEAVDMLMEAVKAFPTDPEPCVSLCLAMEAAGQPEAARHAADLALERDAQSGCFSRLTFQQRRVVDQRLHGEGKAASPGSAVSSSATAGHREGEHEEEDDDWGGGKKGTEAAADDHMTALEGARGRQSVARTFVVESDTPERCRARKAGMVEASSQEEQGAAGFHARSSGGVRQLQFGPQVQGIGLHDNDSAIKEAAMRDLETLFTNLMPGRASRAKGPHLGGASDAVVSEGMSGCCSCRRQVLESDS